MPRNFTDFYYYDVLKTPPRPNKSMSAWGFGIFRPRPGTPLTLSLDLTEEFYVLASDQFYPLRLWPKIWKDLLFNPHKDRHSRYRLFVFLWANGMPAHHAVYWTMWHQTYDRQAWASIVDAANDTLTVDGVQRLSRNRVYDFELSRVN